ncbi:MAG: UDP-N-acetylmuramoyl-tripeptide--D-alanyl-D-alanine ligase [Candidatus Levybacteria bacterium]|nr:UDP-N-acetylmuramoyl-tripeptide--D-alanyl-D-alanine ligase [Candidatus Levybacteria bacterium]
MQILFIASEFFLAVWVLRNTLFWLNLWQIKEYRLDRLWVHLQETVAGRKILFSSVVNLLKNFAFLFYVVLIVKPTFLNIESSIIARYNIFVGILLLYSFSEVLVEISTRAIKRPILTLKIILIFLLTIVASFFLFSFLSSSTNKFFSLLFVDKFLPFIVALFIGLFAFPSWIVKKQAISKATQKIQNAKQLIRIGITGSYGKGSTKEYLAAILSQKFQVLKTFETINTAIGIAKTINSRLTPNTQVFAAEMGAYKKGEIKELCEIVKPRIGILTSVIEQHASLFGGLAKTKSAKYELIESLPQDGLALFNGNNANTLELYKKAKVRKILYFADYGSKEKIDADIIAENIKMGKFDINFDVRTTGKRKINLPVKVNLLGGYNAENILPAIFLGLELGMDKNEIQKGLSEISPIKKTMQPFLSTDQTVIVDDTFNSNPQAVLAALSYLKIYKGKKVLVLSPIIELGKNARQIHYDLAKEIGKACDVLFLTNMNFYEEIKKGIGENCRVLIQTPQEISAYIARLGENDIVILEGKEAGKILNFIAYEKAN